jgi:hypothetical protein
MMMVWVSFEYRESYCRVSRFQVKRKKVEIIEGGEETGTVELRSFCARPSERGRPGVLKAGGSVHVPIFIATSMEIQLKGSFHLTPTLPIWTPRLAKMEVENTLVTRTCNKCNTHFRGLTDYK